MLKLAKPCILGSQTTNACSLANLSAVKLMLLKPPYCTSNGGIDGIVEGAISAACVYAISTSIRAF